MEDLFEGFSESITDWETIREITELDLDEPPPNVDKIDHRIHRFPRQDYSMYGIIPKLEQRTYVRCKDCKLIFSSQDIMYHKTCAATTEKTKTPEKKPKTRGATNRKKSNTFPLPLGFSSKTSSPNRAQKDTKETSSKINKHLTGQGTTTPLKYHEINSAITEPELKGASPGVPSPSCLSNDSLSLDGDSSSPLRTSSTRSSKKLTRKHKLTKEYDPDFHCGVVDAHKGPCMRSITCSNHRIQLKKLVPGRSKDIHQLISEKRLAKERDLLLNQSIAENEKMETVNTTVEEAEQTPVVISGTSIEVSSQLSTSTSDMIDISRQHVIEESVDEEVLEVKDDMKHSEEYIEALHNPNNLQELKFSASLMDQENCLKSLEGYDFTQFNTISPEKEDINYFTNLNNIRFASNQDMKFFENFDFTHLAPLAEDYDCGKPLRLAEIQPMFPLEVQEKKEDTFLSEAIANVSMLEAKPLSFKIQRPLEHQAFRLAEIQPMSPLEVQEKKEDTFLSEGIANISMIEAKPVNFNIGKSLEQEEFTLAEIQPMSPFELQEENEEDTFMSKAIANVPAIEAKPVSFKIPDVESDVFGISTHPNPIALPNYGTKNVGGAILLNKPHMQCQRNDILRAVNDSRVNFAVNQTSSKSKKNHCTVSANDSDIEYKQMRLDPNLNHFLMQCEIRKPYNEVLLEECLQENYARNTFTSTIDFE